MIYFYIDIKAFCLIQFALFAINRHSLQLSGNQSVTRLGDILDFGQLFNASGNN